MKDKDSDKKKKEKKDNKWQGMFDDLERDDHEGPEPDPDHDESAGVPAAKRPASQRVLKDKSKGSKESQKPKKQRKGKERGNDTDMFEASQRHFQNL